MIEETGAKKQLKWIGYSLICSAFDLFLVGDCGGT